MLVQDSVWRISSQIIHCTQGKYFEGQQSCFRQITCFLRTEHEYILVACMIPSKSHCAFSQIPCAAGRLPRMPTFTCPMTVKPLSRAWLQVRPEMHTWGMRFWIARLAKSFRFVLNISCTDLQLHFFSELLFKNLRSVAIFFSHGFWVKPVG